MRAFHSVSVINLFALLVLCALVLSLAGCDGGVGEVAAIDGAASDAAATAATDVAAETAADAVTETAIEGSTDIALDLDGEILAVEPFSTALEMGDSEENLAAGLSGVGPDGTTIMELNDKTTGDLQMVAMTTRSLFQAEAAFLDVQHKRLILKAIEREGEAPTWDYYDLGDRPLSDLQQTKKLEFTAADGTPRFFTQQKPAGSAGQ
jgi:hypothetical protein